MTIEIVWPMYPELYSENMAPFTAPYSLVILRELILLYLSVPYTSQVKNYGPFRQESARNRRNVEAVSPPGNFRIFSDDFRPFPVESHRKLTGIQRKKIHQISGRNTASTSGYFRRFPAGACGIHVAVIFDLGR